MMARDEMVDPKIRDADCGLCDRAAGFDRGLRGRGPFGVRPVRDHLHGRWFGRPPASADATPQRLRCLSCRMQQFTGSRSRKRGVLAGPLSCDAEASGVFCRTIIIATAASAARIARTADAILT